MEFDIIDHQDWHTEEDYPSDLTPLHALTHMGMYFAWAAENNLLHPTLLAELTTPLQQLYQRHISGRDVIDQYLGKQLLLSYFNELGQRFTAFYYTDDEDGYGQFLSDYVQSLRTDLLPSFYHVEDNADAYAALAAQFNLAYARWFDSLKVKN